MSRADGRVVVPMGESAVLRGEGLLLALGLGSCVAVLLHDPGANVGGMAHVLLPSQSLCRDRSNPARAADTAVPLLVRSMEAEGGMYERMVARLAGGATMFGDLLPPGSVHIGERNVVQCRASLRELGIPVVGEAVGGTRGRSIWFDVRQGVVTVRSVGDESILL